MPRMPEGGNGVQNLADMRGEQRNNHPLCEFEWTDKESGLRFYDDPLEGW